MKIYLSLIALLLTCQFVFAQSDSNTRINIKLNNTHLRVASDDDKLVVDYHFDKEKTWDLIQSMNKNLDVATKINSNNNTYLGTTKGCSVRISKGKLNIDLDKSKMSNSAKEQLTEAILEGLLAADVDFSGTFEWD